MSLLVFYALAGLNLLGCVGSPPAPAGPPDVVVITLDTTRADHLGAWGYSAARTPNLDALAKSGVRYSRATTVSNNTLPAHVSVLSGLHPQTAGLPRNGHELAPNVPWVPEKLAAAGYDTAAFVSASALSSKLGLSRGFGVYSDDFDVSEMDQQQRRADTTTAEALAWLTADRDKPAFMWVHYFDPHYPYTPPAPFDQSLGPAGYAGPADGSLQYLLQVWGRGGRKKIQMSPDDQAHMVSRYDAELAWLDSAMGPLLRELDDRADRTLVVLTADHGESLTEHEYLFDHGEFVYQPSLHIPLIVRAPTSWKVSPGVRDGLVQGLDVGPTVLAAAGLPVAGLDGIDLGPSLRDPGAPLRDVVFSESCRPWSIERKHRDKYANLYKAQSATRWPYKLIVTPHADTAELYDLEKDPGETVNLLRSGSPPSDIVDQLAADLNAWRGTAVAQAVANPENMRQLEALGYIE